MKKLMVSLILLFCAGVWSQENSFRDFQTNFAYGLRVVQAPCPEQLHKEFPKALCYQHGYKDFFDFKEAVGPYLLDAGGLPKPWHVATLRLGNEPVEVIKTMFHPRQSKQQITLVYVSDGLLLLTAKDLSSSP